MCKEEEEEEHGIEAVCSHSFMSGDVGVVRQRAATMANGGRRSKLKRSRDRERAKVADRVEGLLCRCRGE